MTDEAKLLPAVAAYRWRDNDADQWNVQIGRPVERIGVRTIEPLGVIENERCIACDEPFFDGDLVLPDVDGGRLHAACCGPERESYVGEDGEPLQPGEAIPKPYRWTP